MNYILTYIPRGINAARACDIRTRTIYAMHARHAAIRADSFARRTGAQVLTVREEGK